MEPLRVAHLITRLEPGGAQRNTLYTVTHLDRGLFRPALICGRGGELDGEAQASGVPVTFVDSLVRPVHPWRDARALGALTRELRALRPEIVHTHSSKAGILGRLAAWRAKVPVIVHTVHGFGFHPQQWPPKRALFLGAERMVAAKTTHFILVSEANRQQGAALGLFSRSRSSLIRSGIDLARYRDALPDREGLQARWGIPMDAPLVGMVGCLKPQKAPQDFVEVARRVSQSHPDCHYLLVGDGTLRRELEQAATSAGLDGRFHLVGWRNDVHRILKSLDVLVHTSRWEGLARVLPESLSAGVPVVVTRVDGATDVVRDGINGFLAQAGDVQTLASRTVELLSHPALRRRLGSSGLERGEEFEIETMVRRQEELYLRLWRETATPRWGAVREGHLAGSGS
jgi:glycosyltransferase involved in cell wall biosynthesis